MYIHSVLNGTCEASREEMQAQLTCVGSTIERLSLMWRGFGRYNTVMQVSILSLAKKLAGFLPERREEKRQEKNIAAWGQQRSNSKHTGCGAEVGMVETEAGRDQDGEKQHHLPCLLALVRRCESTLYWEEPHTENLPPFLVHSVRLRLI